MENKEIIVTNTGVYDLEVYDKDHTVPEYGKAYVASKDYNDDDIFYLYRGKIKRSSIEPGIYVDSDGFHEFIEPDPDDRVNYIIKTHLANMEPGNMLVVLKDKKNIQHVYNESTKLTIPEINSKDNILKRALKQAFHSKHVSIEEVKDGFSDRNAFFNFSSVMRSEDGNISFLLMDRGCQALKLGYSIILYELDEENPVGKSLTAPDVQKEINRIPIDMKNPIISENDSGASTIDGAGKIIVSSEDSFNIP